MIKTVTLTGSEVKVTDLGGQNAAVKNLGSGSIYVSTKPNITAGADNVIEIPAGAGEVVLDANGTVYIVGTGKVQCTGTPYAVPNFKLPSSSNGGGGGTSDVTKEYVDAQDTTNLNLAKSYTDNAKSEIQTTIDTVNDTLNTHIADQVKHITAEERTAWNAVNYINPNLLMNPDFKINQRGQDVYSGTMHTADCWRCITSTGQVTVGSGGITVTDTAGGECKINNYVEGDLTGKTITLSACIDGTICKVSGLATADMTTWDKQLKVYFDGGYLLFGCYNVHKFFIMFASAAEKSFSCQWVKLELGSIATPFCPPDPATELAKCQRYYQIRSTNDIDPVDLRPSMRATPTDIKKVTGGYAYVAEL